MGLCVKLLMLIVAGSIGYYAVNDFVGNYQPHAILTACSSCRLTKLPEIKQFINEEAPKIDRLLVEYAHGDPIIRIYESRSAQQAAKMPRSRKKQLAHASKLGKGYNIADMTNQEVIQFLADHGVYTLPEPEEESNEEPLEKLVLEEDKSSSGEADILTKKDL